MKKRKATFLILTALLLTATLCLRTIFQKQPESLFEVTQLKTTPAVRYAIALNDKGELVCMEGPQRITLQDRNHQVIASGEVSKRGSHINDMNNKGQSVGGFWNSGLSSAYLWCPSAGLVIIGTGRFKDSNAIALNESSQVAGFYYKSNTEFGAFVWDESTGMSDIGTLGGKDTGASDINDTGRIVGSSETKEGADHAFVWHKETGMIDLHEVVGNAQSSRACGINNAGWILIEAILSYKSCRILLYHQEKGVVELGNFKNYAQHMVGPNEDNMCVVAIRRHRENYFNLTKDLGHLCNYYVLRPNQEPALFDDTFGGIGSQLEVYDINNSGQLAGTLNFHEVGLRYVTLTPLDSAR